MMRTITIPLLLLLVAGSCGSGGRQIRRVTAVDAVSEALDLTDGQLRIRYNPPQCACAPFEIHTAQGWVRANFTEADEEQDLDALLAKAEATLRSARAYLYETADEVWAIVCSGRTLDAREEACARLAVMHALDAGAKAVDIVYRAAGTSAIFTNNPLERYFRDIHVATQHFAGSPEGMFTIGAVLLGGTNG